MTLDICIYFYLLTHSQVTYGIPLSLYINSAACEEAKESLGCRQSEIQAALQDM